MTMTIFDEEKIINAIDKAFNSFAKREQIINKMGDTDYHVYTNVDNDIVCIKSRVYYIDKQGKKSKFMRFFSVNNKGNFVMNKGKVENNYPQGKGKLPIYLLPSITQANNDDVIYIFEGEQKADLAVKLGFIATTTGSCTSVNQHDLQPLAGKKVVLWCDNDTAGFEWLKVIVTELSKLDCNIKVIDVDKLGLNEKDDIVDWYDGLMASGEYEESDLVPLIKNLPLIEQEQVLGFNTDNQFTSDSIADNTDYSQLENLTEEQIEEKTDDIVYSLAELSDVAYERKRTDMAKVLNIRTTVLDRLVKQARKEIENNANDELIKQVTPYSEPVDGQALLNEIIQVINSVVVCDKATADTVALWIFFTWCINAFDIAPIACITAPQKRCGKTVLLTLIGKMVKHPLESSFITAPALFRMVDKWQPTLLIDEADAFLKSDEDMRGVINLGHTRGKKVIRCTGDDNEPQAFNVFGAKVISGIGKLTDTIHDRSIIFELKRKLPTEKRLRLRDISKEQLQLISEKLARWSSDHIEQLKVTRVELPQSLNDRSQDNWEGLLVIAKVISNDCFNHYTKTAIALSDTIQDEPSTSEQLLLDIKEVFDNWYDSKIGTHDLIQKLCEDDEKIWSNYNFKSVDKKIKPSQLAKKLSEFNIKSNPIRLSTGVKKGYKKSDFDDVFKRYTAYPLK